MNKYIYSVKSVIVYIVLFIICCSLSSCANDKGAEANTSQGIDVTKENFTATPCESTKRSPSPTIVPTVPTTSEIPISKEAHDVKHSEHTILHEKDGSSYKIDVIYDEQYGCTIKLFNENSTELQTVELGWALVEELLDVNTDGYTDIVVNTGGTVNETHDLYIWDSVSKNFVKVIYEGFDMLAWFTVREGYIENFIRGDTPEESFTGKLIWKENTLIWKENILVKE